MKTGIVMATMLEAKPFIEGISLKLKSTKPFHLYENANSALIISGIGKVNSALATAYILQEYNFKVLYNLGAAGALKTHINKGAIFQIKEVIDYDRPLLRGGLRKYESSTCSDFDLAILATTDRPVVEYAKRLDIGQIADLVDMEAAGFLQACRIFGVDGFLWKIVSDTVDDNKDSDIVENIKNLIGDLYIFFEDKILKRQHEPERF